VVPLCTLILARLFLQAQTADVSPGPDTARRATVTGQVTDARSGAGVAGAVVTLPQWTVSRTADSTGRFAISGVPAGRYAARVEHVGYVPRLLSVLAKAGDTITLRAIVLAPAAAPRPPCQLSRASTPDALGLTRPYAFGRPRAVPPGSLVQLYAWTTPSDRDYAVTAEGKFAGQPVTLGRTSRGRFVGLGAVPLDSTRGMPYRVTVTYASGTVRSVTVSIRLAPKTVAARRTERLAVAPTFGREPAPVEATRIAAENDLARGIAVQSLRTAPLWTRPFIKPRPGAVTSGFGAGREFNGTVTGRHLGTDFRGAVGDPVVAANRGIVALVADFFLAGTVIYIDHGGGLVSGYFHLSRTDVAVGDTVSRGQVIGAVGHSGRVTGPHLHWSMRFGAVPVDPMSVFAIAPLPGGPPVAGCQQ
jgi:murein DD-endopeptidase MepM/ murein hydrolase activator NlpD